MIKQIKKNKLHIFSFMLVIISIVLSFFIIAQKTNQNKNLEYIELKENVTDYYFVKQYGTIVIRLENDEIWEISKDSESKFISSDIRYIAECSSNGSELLIICNNGDIYYDADRNYQGVKIGNIAGAISGSISSIGLEKYIMIVTEDGDLYAYAMDQNGTLENYDKEFVDQLTKVDGIPKVKKVVALNENTLILTNNGEIYHSGDYNSITVRTEFQECYSEINYIDIAYGQTSAYALDDEGIVYTNDTKERNGNNYMDFTENKAYENIVSMCVNQDFAAFLNEEQKIYYNGTYYPGKAVENFEGRPFAFHGTEEIILHGHYIYMIKEGKAYIKDLSR